MRRLKKTLGTLLTFVIVIAVYLWPYVKQDLFEELAVHQQSYSQTVEVLNSEANGEKVTVYNDNKPYFSTEELVPESYEYYSDLDVLGRCGEAVSMLGEDLMPTGERESISSIKPTGWHTVRYDDLITAEEYGNPGYLYNRCHLIGYQLTGENANKQNLITCTRSANLAMVPYENLLADYVKKTKNHVLYRVTPVFEGANLVANGILMEAYSVEDSGELQFCVYVKNIQPGVVIDYATGESHAEVQ